MKKKTTRAKKPAKKKPTRKKAGQPRKTWTKKQLSKVEELAADGCTQKIIADYLGCVERTVWDRINTGKDIEFLRSYKKGRAVFLVDIMQKQKEVAMFGGVEKRPGQATMLIWLGKQHLEQRDIPVIHEDTQEEITRTTSLTDGTTVIMQPGSTLIGSGYVAQVDRQES